MANQEARESAAVTGAGEARRRRPVKRAHHREKGKGGRRTCQPGPGGQRKQARARKEHRGLMGGPRRSEREKGTRGKRKAPTDRPHKTAREGGEADRAGGKKESGPERRLRPGEK